LSTKANGIVLRSALAAMVVANALLLWQNFGMRRELESVRPRSLEVGEGVPPFKSVGLQGETIEVGYASGAPRRVLLYFTPTCVFCRQQFPHWKEVLRRAGPAGFEVLGIADESEDPEKLREYLRAMGCGPDSDTPLRVALVSKKVLSDYKLSATPATVIVGGGGGVEKVWTGRWSPTERRDAASTFGFELSAR